MSRSVVSHTTHLKINPLTRFPTTDIFFCPPILSAASPPSPSSMSSIQITAGGYRFVALPNAAAPRTVAAFTALLPYRQKMIHVRWSGEACWIPLGDFDLKTGFENHTSHPSVGDILFYPGGFSETEILIAYGSCCFSSKVGQLAGNHFLTIVEGRENLRPLGVDVLWGGAKDILFEQI
jgi:hypothetical protein